MSIEDSVIPHESGNAAIGNVTLIGDHELRYNLKEDLEFQLLRIWYPSRVCCYYLC